MVIFIVCLIILVIIFFIFYAKVTDIRDYLIIIVYHFIKNELGLDDVEGRNLVNVNDEEEETTLGKEIVAQ